MTEGLNLMFMNDIMNDIVNTKKGHNIVNNSFAYKPDRLLVM